MKITQTIKKVIKPHVDAPTWVDLNFLSQSITGVVELTKKLIIPVKPTYEETFEEATQRLNLTEEDIAKRLKQFQQLTTIFTAIGCLILGYLLFLIFEKHYISALLAFAATAITCSQIFRYHFWAFQLKQRKLGCTFKEWRQSLFKRTEA